MWASRNARLRPRHLRYYVADIGLMGRGRRLKGERSSGIASREDSAATLFSPDARVHACDSLSLSPSPSLSLAIVSLSSYPRTGRANIVPWYRGGRRADRFVDSRTPLLGIASRRSEDPREASDLSPRRRHLAHAPPPSLYAASPPPPSSPPFFPFTSYISPSQREKESEKDSRSLALSPPPPPPSAIITFLSRRVQGIHWSLYLRHGALLVSRSSGPAKLAAII